MRGFLRYSAAAIGCVLLTALPAAAQFDRGISGTSRMPRAESFRA